MVAARKGLRGNIEARTIALLLCAVIMHATNPLGWGYGASGLRSLSSARDGTMNTRRAKARHPTGGWRRAKIGVFCALLAALVLAIWLRRSDRTAPASASLAARHSGFKKQSLEDQPIFTARQQNDEPTTWHVAEGQAPDPNRPVIQRARLEKPEVCRGEEDFLDVAATTANGTDAFLTVSLFHPQTGKIVRGGSRIPFRMDTPSTRDIRVIVEGKNSAQTIILPAVKVKDCVAPRQVRLGYQRSQDAFERIHFVAQLKVSGESPESAAQPFATSYEWDFGDGNQQTTNQPAVDHSYEDRDQGVAQSSFLVTVKIKSDRQEDQGSTVLAFTNLGFVPLTYENKVVLSVGVAPPGPERGESEKIWLYHGYSKSVRLTHAVLREVVIDPSTHAEHETFKRDYAPEVLLGFSEIAAKESRVARDLSGLQPIDAATVRYVEVTGTTSDGKTVVGSFSLLPEKPAANLGEKDAL